MIFNSEGVKKDKSSKLIRYVGYCISAIGLFIIIFFAYVQLFCKSDNVFGGSAEILNLTWTWEKNDGTREIVRLPADLNVELSEKVVLSSTLPPYIPDGKYLCFLLRDSMRIYVGGELYYSFDSTSNPVVGDYVKSHYVLVEITKECTGKKITIVKDNPDTDNGNFNSIIFGDKIGIVGQLVHRHGAQFGAAVILLLLSIMVIIIGYFLLIIYKRKMPIILLGYATALAALWFIFDSFLYQVVMRNYYVDGPMEYMLIMIIPYYFARYLNYQQERRYEFFYTILCAGAIVNFVANTIMHFSGIASFESHMPIISAYCGVAALFMLITILIDIKKMHVQRYILVAIAYAFLLVAGIVQITLMLSISDYHSAVALVIGMFLVLVMGVVNMIVKLDHMETQARREKRENELKSSFLANMSHEIRTPVNAILGMNEMISRESTEADIKKYSENIDNAGKTLLDIINDILDFSKIGAGKMEIIPADFELSNLLFNVKNIIEVRAFDKDLLFSIETSSKIPNKLNGDSSRIQQILLNILNNAVKYTDNGSVRLVVEINGEQTAKLNEENTVVLSFSAHDTGIGIKEEDMDKLFKTFERIDLAKNRSIEGTGLGLSIAKSLLEYMGGNMSVQSEYGKGSVFTINLPLKIVGDEELGDFGKRIERSQKAKEKEKESFIAPDARVLIVDDVPMNIAVIKGLLKRNKVQVVGSPSGADCLKKCKDEKFDLILLDHMMPEMDGIETLKHLKEEHKDICPVVVLTANAIQGMKEMYLEKGFDDYLSKPTKPEDLENVVKKFVSAEKIILQKKEEQ